MAAEDAEVAVGCDNNGIVHLRMKPGNGWETTLLLKPGHVRWLIGELQKHVAETATQAPGAEEKGR